MNKLYYICSDYNKLYMGYFKENQTLDNINDEIASQTSNNLNNGDVVEIDDLTNKNIDNGFDTRNVMPLEQYNGEQLKIAFADDNINRLTEKLGRKPSDMEVIEDYINSGKAEDWSKKNRAA